MRVRPDPQHAHASSRDSTDVLNVLVLCDPTSSNMLLCAVKAEDNVSRLSVLNAMFAVALFIHLVLEVHFKAQKNNNNKKTLNLKRFPAVC